MSNLSTDEIEILCHNLVYQVAYAYYDSPYILVLKLLMNYGVCPEVKAAEILGINPPDFRKYCGVLQSHRLIKRYSNKERLAPDDRSFFRRGAGPQVEGQARLKEVAYWYIDYREFANVTKYKLAMCHKGIEEATKHHIGQRGYRCPGCGKTFDALQVPNLMDPSTGLLYCDQCGTAVEEYDPNAQSHDINGSGDERITRFNKETQYIRDALKAIEGIMVPSVNIVAWIAQNVKQAPLPGQTISEEGDKKKYQVVIGDEGDERERIEKARLAEAQRTQNALPIWHTHSTVTGSATSLGLGKDDQKDPNAISNKRDSIDGKVDNQQGLADYYANLVEEDEDDPQEEEEIDPGEIVKAEPVDLSVSVKAEPVEMGMGMGDEDEEEEDDEEMDPSSTVTPANGSVMVMGKPKPFDEVTTDDEAYLMSAEEREAYETLMMSM